MSDRTSGSIRVLITDDHLIVREGLSLILDTDDEIEVVAEARDGAEALRLVKEHRPSVVLMDLQMPGMDGLTAIQHLRREHPDLAIVILTTFNEDELMITAVYKAKGYAHVLFAVGQENYYRLGRGLLDYDGHGTFSPDGRWMVTDTYPGNDGLYEQKLYLMDMKSEAVISLGRYIHHPEFRKNQKDAQCDLHPRWSPKSDMIGFNSVTTGERQVYIINLK